MKLEEQPLPDKDALMRVYRRAVLIHENDRQMRQAIRKGELAIIYYSPRGQEIIPAAISDHLTERDYLVTIYRGIHDQVAKGIPLKELWAEYAGRVTGTCKGKGGPMHITHPATGVMVTTGVVGSGLPIANGLALASQIAGEDRVTVVNFGDGASNIGAFHEALNLASVWKLPVIFLCQNNGYAEHTRYADCTAVESIAKRAASYDMPGISVNGNDPQAMWQASKLAVERARRGDGPTLLEAMTFRFEGHLLGDPGHYIPKAEMQAAKEADPIPLFRRLLMEAFAVEESLLETVESEAAQQVTEARQFALHSPYPELHENRLDILLEASL